mgnify:FL=1
MVQECYDWVWKLAGYLIFMTAVLQLVPGEKDRKYIHFFPGLVLIILIASPVIKFFTSDDLFVQFQDQYDAMETQVEEMLKNTSGLESVMKSQDNRNAEDASQVIIATEEEYESNAKVSAPSEESKEDVDDGISGIKILSAKTYNITFAYDPDSGYVTAVGITEKTSK